MEGSFPLLALSVPSVGRASTSTCTVQECLDARKRVIHLLAAVGPDSLPTSVRQQRRGMFVCCVVLCCVDMLRPFVFLASPQQVWTGVDSRPEFLDKLDGNRLCTCSPSSPPLAIMGLRIIDPFFVFLFLRPSTPKPGSF